ncbi:MAG TPA: hypothetical protein VFD58_17620 [Blastocatellia bacterium]|nr:hypothetical protein [Blastocatellia bacterium]
MKFQTLDQESVFQSLLKHIGSRLKAASRWRPDRGLRLSVVGGLIIAAFLTILLPTAEIAVRKYLLPSNIYDAGQTQLSLPILSFVILFLNLPGYIIAIAAIWLGHLVQLTPEQWIGLSRLIGILFGNTAVYAFILYWFHGRPPAN